MDEVLIGYECGITFIDTDRLSMKCFIQWHQILDCIDVDFEERTYNFLSYINCNMKDDSHLIKKLFGVLPIIY